VAFPLLLLASLLLGAASAQSASVTLASSSTPATFGQSITLTAAISPPTATGKVTFYDGPNLLGIAPVAGGVAAFKTTQIGFGKRSLKAHYSGDGENPAANSAAIPVEVTAISDSGFPTFTPNPTPANVNFIATGDFNGDGNLDLALTMVDQVMILLGKGNGSFTQGQPFFAGNVTSVTSVAVGDFNGDGIPDLAVSDYADVAPGSPNLVWIMLGEGNGQFGPPVSFPVDCAPVQVLVADFNQDGNADLVVVGTPVGTADISVLLGNGNGTFRAPLDFASVNAVQGAVGLTLGDFNGDGIPDLAVLDTDLSVLLGNGDGTFGPALYNATGNGPIGIATGDFNQDGITDLVVANNTDGTVSILLGLGNGQFRQQTPYAVQSNSAYAYPSSVTVGDFNGDNIPDVAVANYEDGESSLISILFGTGSGALNSSLTYAGGAGAEILVQGDFNNDGAIDLAVADGNGSNSGGDVGVLIATRCYYGLSAPPLNYDANGGSALLNISTETGCGWSASADPDWAYFSALNGFGSGQVLAIIPPNTSGVERTASVAVSGIALPVTEWSTVQQFADVTPADYEFDAVNLLKGKNITDGCSTDDYCPTESITRAQMAIFVVRAVYNGSDNFPYSTTPYFSDVSPADFGFAWIQHMYELGITTGCGSGLFCPDDTVTRAEMAIFLIRARYGALTPFTSPAPPYFADVPEGSFGFTWIQRLKEDNITSGCTPTDYCPSEAVDRGDMAIFLMRGEFNQLLPAGEPVIASMNPSTLAAGASGSFTVTGLDTTFLQGTTAMVPVGGVTASGLTVISPTSFTVTLTAGPDAAQVPVSIYVQTGSQEAVLPNGLLVEAPPASLQSATHPMPSPLHPAPLPYPPSRRLRKD
jgi:hypothetical protein